MLDISASSSRALARCRRLNMTLFYDHVAARAHTEGGATDLHSGTGLRASDRLRAACAGVASTMRGAPTGRSPASGVQARGARRGQPSSERSGEGKPVNTKRQRLSDGRSPASAAAAAAVNRQRPTAADSGDEGSDGSPGAAGGDRSGDSTPGQGPSGTGMAREDSLAGTAASGEAGGGARCASAPGDGRKRSRKASAPRR